MIQHIVMLNLADDGDLPSVMEGLGTLVGQIDGFMGFDHGPNIDVEGKSPDFPYGFVCQFRDRAALDEYAADPRHQAYGQRLVAMCRGGAEGIMVIDLQVAA